MLVALALAAGPVAAQDENPTTPGAIPDPGSYQGSMALQQEQQGYQQQEQQNQQVQQRLDQNYRQYAPSGGVRAAGAGRAGPPAVDWWKRPALPPARNPLLGRWKQVASAQQTGGSFGALMLPGAASLVNGAMAGGCESMFGKGVIAFEPDSLQWVAPDGHEEILNHVAYRASGSNVVVLSRDPGAIPALFFGFPNPDHAVTAFFNCGMDRLGAQRVKSIQLAASPGAGTAAANAVLKFNVGAATPGNFTPFGGARIWVTPQSPNAALAGAGLAPPAGGSAADRMAATAAMARPASGT
ncbi:hypothetical protein [Phenylobacterium sp.]|uniref:hypothetical protein n=1 Tax=Phenylobacterium sp. TaxID=1871053 RepID=UPI002F3F74AB